MHKKPYEVYKKIIASRNDGKLARLVMVTLLSDASIKARVDYHENGEYALEECCGKLGLKVATFDCDGSMSDFAPDRMRW